MAEHVETHTKGIVNAYMRRPTESEFILIFFCNLVSIVMCILLIVNLKDGHQVFVGPSFKFTIVDPLATTLVNYWIHICSLDWFRAFIVDSPILSLSSKFEEMVKKYHSIGFTISTL